MGDTASECKRDRQRERERERDAWTIQSSQTYSLNAKWIIQQSRHINITSMLRLAMTNALSSTHFTRYSYIHPLHVLTWMENRSKPFKRQYVWSTVRNSAYLHTQILSNVPSAIWWLTLWPWSWTFYSLAHHFCKMWIFYEPRRVTVGNTRHFVEE